MIESGRVPGNGRICASNEKHCRQVLKNGRISVSTRKWSNPGEYREKVESERVSNNCPDEYLKRGESVLVQENGRICASNEKLYRRVLKNGIISVTTGKW